MSKTSKVDLEKYLPSVEDSLALCDEDAAAARIRKALEDPPLEASPKKEAGTAAKPSAPAKAGAPVKASAPAPLMFMGKELPPLRTVLFGIGVVFLPVILVILLFVKPEPTGVQVAPTIWIEAGVKAQETVAAPTATASAGTASSAIPSAAPSVPAQKPKVLAPRGTIAPRTTAAPLPTVKPIIIN
jgi:hypothetical protein